MKSQLINYLLEASICQVVFYLFYKILLQKESFFAWNRGYILASVLLSLLIPVIEIPLSQQALYLSQQPAIYNYSVFIPEEKPAVEPVNSFQPQSIPAGLVSGWHMAFYGYVLICALLFIRLFYQLYSLYKTAASSRKEYKNGYTLFYTKGSMPTFSFFHWLFWNHTDTFQPESQNLILQHELVHIRQKHSCDTLFLELIKVFFWFNPAVYLFKRALQEIHEYLADKSVIKAHNSKIYTSLLVQQHLKHLPVSFAHSFNHAQINKRIAMIQATHKFVKPAIWKLAFVLPLMAALMFMYSCKTSEITELKPGIEANGGVYRLSEIVITGYAASKSQVDEIRMGMIDQYGQLQRREPAVVFNRADVLPQPVNGMKRFEEYIRQNLRYPLQAEKAGIRGKVFVEFIVNTDGSLSHFSVVKGIGGGCDEQAVQLIKNGPVWTPGKQDGKQVSVRKVIPVSFGTQLSETVFAQAQPVSDKPAENQPAPVAGFDAFYKNIGKNIRYPHGARTALIEGQVWVQFTVHPDGSLSQIELAEALHPELDQEVIRVVSASGLRWKPASINGKAQPVRLLLPLSFKLG